MAVAATSLNSGSSLTATTACSFTAQAAGTWLLLIVSSDDYRTTAGANRPESTGWALDPATPGQDFLGFYVWKLLATGSETSVSYTIGSAVPSAWVVVAVTGATSTVFNTPTMTHTHGGGSTTPSTSATPPAANALALACCGAMHSSTSITAATGWSNSYTAVAFQAGPASGSREAVGVARLATTTATATSSTVTWNGAQLCSYGTTLIFQESGAAPALPPILVMAPRTY